MSNSFYRSPAPPELYVSARQFDPVNWQVMLGKWADDGERWRRCVPPSIAQLWSRLDERGRLVVFVMAHETLRRFDERRKAKPSVSRMRSSHAQRQLAPLPRAPFMVLRNFKDQLA